MDCGHLKKGVVNSANRSEEIYIRTDGTFLKNSALSNCVVTSFTKALVLNQMVHGSRILLFKGT